jgi:putative transposase
LFESAGKLNSMARQAMAQRAIFAIGRFFSFCKALKPGKKDIHPSKSRLVL